MIDISGILKTHKILPIDSWNSLLINYKELSEEDILVKIIDFSFKKSGVYLYRDNDSNLVLYIGRSIDISKRLIAHYREYKEVGFWGKNKIFHNFFKKYSNITILYYEVESIVDQTLIEIMLQEYYKHKFYDYYSSLKKLKN